MPCHVVVIGAGVIGLSAAHDLQQAGHNVTILARDFPQPAPLIDGKSQINYTSPWGGAHNRWVPPSGQPDIPREQQAQEQRDHRLALATYRRMKALASDDAAAGITFMKGVEYLEAPGPEYAALVKDGGQGSAKALGVEGFRLLAREELPDERVALGFEYDTWCVNPMVYCSFLLHRLVYRGGRVVKREVREPAEVFAMAAELGIGRVDCVVNASGVGFGDEKVFVTRGQTCLIANKIDATITRQNKDGTWTFCVPRNFDGGTIIGGTKEPDNWDPEPSLEVRNMLLHNFATLAYPPLRLQDVQVIRDVVGRRPTRRGGARLEREEIAPGKVVVHAYGLGGRGFEMSWGVAETVVELVGRGTKEAKAIARI